MRDPRDRPLVEHRVAVVVARKRRGARGERPGVSDRQQREGDECRPAGVKPRPSRQWLAEPHPRLQPTRAAASSTSCYAAHPLEDADGQQFPQRHPFPRQLPGGNGADLCLIARRPHQLERRDDGPWCAISTRTKCEPRASLISGAVLPSTCTVPVEAGPQLEPVESLAEDGQIAERARARLILIGERLSGEPTRDAQRRSRRRRRDRRADHDRERDRGCSSHGRVRSYPNVRHGRVR